MPHHLQIICCRCDTYKYPEKDQCYIFLSLRPGREEEFKKGLMYQRMDKYYTVLFHERITTSRERKAREKQGKSTEETILTEKEKGVDVNIGIQIVDTIRKAIEAGNHNRTRIVLVSGDSDFQPVVQYAIDNGVLIGVWCWEGTMSAVYTEFLKEKEKEVGEDIIFYLDDYLYQIGFSTGVLHKWAVKFYKFFQPYPYISTKQEREQAEEIYNSISHYTIAEFLQQEHSETNSSTWNFVIHWSKRSFTISFFEKDLREKFENVLETSDKPLMEKLKKLHHCNKEFKKQSGEVTTNITNKIPVATEKSKYACLDMDTDDESDSDDEDALQYGDDKTGQAIENDDKNDVLFKN